MQEAFFSFLQFVFFHYSIILETFDECFGVWKPLSISVLCKDENFCTLSRLGLEGGKIRYFSQYVALF